jgi:hypothetical protein
VVVTIGTCEPDSGRPLDSAEAEAFAARLTRAAYEVALRHGISGPFAELELDLWRELREVIRDRPGGRHERG